MFLFIALFRMAIFIMLPQHSSMTYYIIDYLYFNFESFIYLGAKFIDYIERLNKRITCYIYKATEDFVASFAP